MTRTYAVIMAGGSGTRFWPMSRQARPKQLLALLTERSLLSETIARVAPAELPPEHVLIVTGQALEAPIRELILGSGVRVSVEPRARNTAPCVALAAALIAHEDPTAVMAVLASDHTIADLTEFRRVFAQASKLAHDGLIVTLGIRPDRPETGYGYIRRGAPLAGSADGVFHVGAFVEKPNLDVANQYLAAGDYDWNSGMFFMRVDVLLDAVDRHLPGLSAGIAGYRQAIGTPGEAEALAACFELAEPISIDYGIMEKETARIAVIPSDFGWSDVGSWRTLLDFRAGEDNFVRGDVTLRDVHDSVVVSTGPHVAVIGLSGVAVVATADAVLVVPIDRAQDVGAIPRTLGAVGRKELV